MKNSFKSFRVKLSNIFIALIVASCSSSGGGSGGSNNGSITGITNLSPIATGGYHTLIVKNDGSLWSFGHNSAGQLGLGDTIDRTTAARVMKEKSNFQAVAAGQYHSLVLDKDGTVLSFGSNDNGQLGTGKIILEVVTPQKDISPSTVPGFDKNALAIAAGTNFSLVLKKDHSLWGFGSSLLGQLGNDTVYNPEPIQVSAFKNNVTAIAAGDAHTLVLTYDGSVYSFGGNDVGQLGYDGNHSSTPKLIDQLDKNVKQIAAYFNESFAVKAADGSLFGFGGNFIGQLGLSNIDDSVNYITPTPIPNMNNIKAITGGMTHTLILKNDGTLWAMGDNGNGQLGLPSTTASTNTATQVTAINKKVVAIAAATNHSLAKDEDGNIWVFGDKNEFGLNKNNSSPEAINIQ